MSIASPSECFLVGLGVPPPGPSFVAEALRLGDSKPRFVGSGAFRRCVGSRTVLEYRRCTEVGDNLQRLYNRAMVEPGFQLRVMDGSLAEVIPGHLVSGDRYGPESAPVMVLGKNPGRDERAQLRNFVGPTSQLFFQMLEEVGVDRAEYGTWYVANVCRWFRQVSSSSSSDTRIPAWAIKDGDPILETELRCVAPRDIICLGADALRALCSLPLTVESMMRRWVVLHIPSLHDDNAWREIRVFSVLHPAHVSRRPELRTDFLAQLQYIVTQIHDRGVVESQKVMHENVYELSRLRELIRQVRIRESSPVIAVDAEWSGRWPSEPGAYLRTIQVSPAPGQAWVVVLRHAGGRPAFFPNPGAAIRELSLLLKHDPDAGYFPRVGGHFFRADLPWLIAEGLDLRAEYGAADTWQQCRTEGGWDTSLARHAVAETGPFGLKELAVRYTVAGNYDLPLRAFLSSDVAGEARDDTDTDDGFGHVPDCILHPCKHQSIASYAAWDADATRRLMALCYRPGGWLDCDAFGNSCWEPYWRAHRASLGVLEMEMTGLKLDFERYDRLVICYSEALARLLSDFRQRIGWSDFNPESWQHRVALLFGEQYVRTNSGVQRRVLPDGVVSFGCRPVKTTGRYARDWDRIVGTPAERTAVPASDVETLGILASCNPLVAQLRDIRLLQTILKLHLCRPLQDETGVAATVEVDGERRCVYPAGLAYWVCRDGRIHPRISQVKETGRWSVSNPSLQNLASRREADYRRILNVSYRDLLGGEMYLYPLRSVFVAPPGWVFVEVDYSSAELAALAWISQDATLLEHVRRNALPKSHPDYYDMHSQMAVRCFNLECEPTAKGLESIGCSALRVAAKAVNFSIMYDGSAAMLARQCREEGIDVNESDCERLKQGFISTYPRFERYREEIEYRARHVGYVVNSFGRFRRVYPTDDRTVMAAQKRELQNFPIQGLVADAVSQAVANLYYFRDQQRVKDYRLLMQVHDSLLLMVKEEDIHEFVDDEYDSDGRLVRPSVLRELIQLRVPVRPRKVDGTPIPVDAPYHFAFEVKTSRYWGVPLDRNSENAGG